MRVIHAAILLYCAWQAADLLDSWGGTPFVKISLWVFLIWLVPLVPLFVRQQASQGSSLLLAGALGASVLGQLGSLHVLAHIGLAMAIVAFAPLSFASLLWLASACSWMPAFGYFARSLPVSIVLVLQLIIALLGSALMSYRFWRKESSHVS